MATSIAMPLRMTNAIPQIWQKPLAALATAWLALFIVMSSDWTAMMRQWWDISTYNHILFVPPIVGWLVWTRRNELRQLAPQAWWPGLIAVAGAAFIWLVGSVAQVNLVSQIGAVCVLQAATVTLLGPRVATGLIFPLAYMLFLVPFGDELVPTLQMITADMVIFLTKLSGISAQIDGVFIDTPAGLFEVAEACSGVKFLIAMVALGALVAHSCFTNNKRRIIFMAVAVILPILANGVRAWGTIYIAQSQGIEFAAGFDHILYGWIFFAIVVGILLASAWCWFDRDPDDAAFDPVSINNSASLANLSRYALGLKFALCGVFAIAAIAAIWSASATSITAATPNRIALADVPGWDRVNPVMQVDWQPRATGADHRLQGRYRNAAGHEVDVFIALYSSQGEGREAGATGEGALRPDTDWRWLEPGPTNAKKVGDVLLARGSIRRVAVTSYRQGDLFTGSQTKLKLSSIADRLLLRPQSTTTLILSAEDRTVDDRFQNGAQAVAQFQDALGRPEEWLDRIVTPR